MPTITIARKHALSQKKAKAVADKIAQDLQKRFELAYEWDGDCVEFERPGVTGQMQVSKDHIKLDVSLGWMLTPLKSTIEREINAKLDTLLKEA